MTQATTVREALLPLARALAEERRAWLLYDDAGGVRTDREVEVLGLAWRGGPWHVAAFCHRRRAFRLLRVDRILRARLTRKPAQPALAPEGFDLRLFSTSGFLAPGGESPALATVCLRSPLSRLATAIFPSALCEWRSPEVVRCHLRATDLFQLASLVVSLGEGAEVCHPGPARDLAATLRGPAG